MVTMQKHLRNQTMAEKEVFLVVEVIVVVVGERDEFVPGRVREDVECTAKGAGRPPGPVCVRTTHGDPDDRREHRACHLLAREFHELRCVQEERTAFVVVHGTLYFLDPDGGDREREAYADAVELLRSIDADVLTSADVTPQRSTLFRIHADAITGRAARSSAD